MSDSSHHVVMDISNGSKAISRLVEMRTRQDPHYKGGGTDRGR